MQNKEFCQREKGKKVIAAFDFDGTITTGDSLPHFFKAHSGVYKTIFEIAYRIPQFIACFFKLIPRRQVKESLISSFFKGMSIDDLRGEGEKFARGPLKKLLKQEALDKIDWHLKRGDRCILISANFDVYLDTFAKDHGFEGCLCSRVDFDDQGIVTGKIRGLNCWGIEKVNRLKELVGDRESYVLYAYGNATGDLELLKYADYAFYKKF